jgi:hypothetical protein
MKFLLCIFFAVTCTSCGAEKKPLITGSTNYFRSNTESLKTSLNLEQRHLIYLPPHHRYVISIGSKLVIDIDHFGNAINVNPYTTLGIDF